MGHQISVNPFNKNQVLLSCFQGIQLIQIERQIMKIQDQIKFAGWSTGVSFFPNQNGLAIGSDYVKKSISLIQVGNNSLELIGQWYKLNFLPTNLDISQDGKKVVVFGWDHLMLMKIHNQKISFIQTITLPSGAFQSYGKFVRSDHLIVAMWGNDQFKEEGFHSYKKIPLSDKFEYFRYHASIKQKIASFDFLNSRQKIIFIDQESTKIKLIDITPENELYDNQIEINVFQINENNYNKYQYLSISTPKDNSCVFLSTENKIFKITFKNEENFNYFRSYSVFLLFILLFFFFIYIINKYRKESIDRKIEKVNQHV